MRYLGIDPGLTGAIAIISDEVEIFDAPTAQVGRKTVLLVSEMVRLLTKLANQISPMVAAIENVHSMPRQGVASSFSFGKGVGYWIGILAALGIPYEEVTPQRWQAAMLDGMQKSKDASRVRAMQMFPQLSEQLKLKRHSGRADALLIAAWRKRQR